MTGRARRSRCASLAVLLWSGAALAQPNAQEKAAAEALFQSGATLIEQQRYAEACEKFDASYTLDPALGTRLRLADCYDRMGRTASAWALFVEVAAAARAQGQTERENIASVRAKDLEERLSRLVLRIDPTHVVPGLTLSMNGTAIPQASWNVAIPVDPGRQRIQVTAPDHSPWSTDFDVSAGPSERTLEIPALRPAPRATQQGPSTQTESPVMVHRESSTHPLVWAGYVTGGVGLVGLGIAGVFGYRAYDRNDESLRFCSSANANACTPQGKELRDDAQSLARASTISAVAGSVLVATGVTLLLVAPSSTSSRQGMVRDVRLNPVVAQDGAGVSLEGVLF